MIVQTVSHGLLIVSTFSPMTKNSRLSIHKCDLHSSHIIFSRFEFLEEPLRQQECTLAKLLGYGEADSLLHRKKISVPGWPVVGMTVEAFKRNLEMQVTNHREGRENRLSHPGSFKSPT